MIRLYQLLLSPLIHFIAGPGFGCRFEPSCSNYAMKCFNRFGLIKALRYSLLRIVNCHPFSSRPAIDEVPEE